jgi:class 3 adenylate cyclase
VSDTDRQLKAIMFSDVKSFSKMMAANEERTMRLIKEHRQIIRAILARYDGEEHGTAGDSFFVLFASAVKAVRCAVEIQETFHKRNADEPEEEQIWIRIGIHIGDIIVDASDSHVYGEGINIAARTEPKAEPGGICITQDVFKQVKNKIDLKVISIGRQEMKNIVDAPELYRIIVGQVEKEAIKQSPSHRGLTSKSSGNKRRLLLLIGLLLLALATAAIVFWWPFGADDNRAPPGEGQVSAVADEHQEDPPSHVPEPKPSAVSLSKEIAFIGRFSAPVGQEGLGAALEALVARRIEPRFPRGVIRWSEVRALKDEPGRSMAPDGAADPAALARMAGARTIVLGEVAPLKSGVWVNLAFYDAEQERVTNRIFEPSTDEPEAIMAALESGLSQALAEPPPSSDTALTAIDASKLVSTRLGMIKHCYERALVQEDGLAGRISVRFSFDVAGRVTEASTTLNELGDVVGSCVETAFLGLETGYRIDEPVSFEVPFLLTPAEAPDGSRRGQLRRKQPVFLDPPSPKN